MRAIEFETAVPPTREFSPLEGSAAQMGVVEPAGSRFGPMLRRVSSQELRRRAWHMFPGLLPFLLWGIPHADPVSPILLGIIIGVNVGLGIAIYAKYRFIARNNDGEASRLSCVVGYAGSVIAATLLFPSALEIAFAVLAILAFGDGTATLFGKMLWGPALAWNGRKSWSGFLAFFVFGVLTATLAYWGETHNRESLTPGVTLATAFLCVLPAVVVAAVAESLPMGSNDNIRVGIVAVICVALMHTMIVGW